MTDPGPRPVITLEVLKEYLTQSILSIAEQNQRNSGGASSFNLGNDKKTPMKKKKPPNKAIETLKKKLAQDKAKLAQTRKELRNTKLSETLQRAETKLKKEQDRIRSLKEKLNVSTGQ